MNTLPSFGLPPDRLVESLEAARQAQDIYAWAQVAWEMTPEQVDADLADAGLTPANDFRDLTLEISVRASWRAHCKAEAARQAVYAELRAPGQMRLL